MGELEFKIIKMPPTWQEFYSNIARSFGWQVHTMQEGIDGVISRGFGTGTSYAMRTAPFTLSSQSNINLHKVVSILTVTYARDLAMPNRNQILDIERRAWQLVDQFVNKAKQSGKWDYSLPEWLEVNRLRSEAASILKQEQISAQASNQSQDFLGGSPDAQPGGNPASTPKRDKMKKQALVNITNVEHNLMQASMKGMSIHLQFNVENCINERCEAIAYFYDAGGKQLKDINQKYRTKTGYVCAGTEFIPAYDNALYDDLAIFMPYKELDLPADSGKHDLKFYVEFYNYASQSFIGKTNFWNFHIQND